MMDFLRKLWAWILSVLHPVLPAETPLQYYAAAWSRPKDGLSDEGWGPKFGDEGYWGWAVPPALTDEALIEWLKAQPEGRRVIQSWDYVNYGHTYDDKGNYVYGGFYEHWLDGLQTADGHTPLYTVLDAQGQPVLNPDGSVMQKPYPAPWIPNAEKLVASKFDAFFKKLKDAGCGVDDVFMDVEKAISMWDARMWQTSWLQVMQGDPRWPELAKRLEPYGVKNLDRVMDFRTYPDYLAFNSVMAAYRAESLNRAVYSVIKKYYPKARVYNDTSIVCTKANAIYDLNGHLSYADTVEFGTHGCREYYGGGYTPNLANRVVEGEVFGNDRFKAFCLNINQNRSNLRSSKQPILPILCPRNAYVQEGTSTPETPTILGSDYWQEMVYHLALDNCYRFNFWNPDDAGAEYDLDQQNKILNDTLEVCAKNVPYDGTPILTNNVPYASEYVVSGKKMRSGSVYRVTFKHPDKSYTIELEGKKYTVSADPGAVGTWIKV